MSYDETLKLIDTKYLNEELDKLYQKKQAVIEYPGRVYDSLKIKYIEDELKRRNDIK